MLFIIIAFLASLCIAIFQYLIKKKERSQLNYWLSFLRFLSIFSILVLLINPSIKKIVVVTQKPNLLVATDNSKSIALNFQNENILKSIQFLKESKALNNKFLLNYFSFGNTINSTDSLTFKENQSNIALPFQEFSNLYKSNVSPVVLITDGNQTKGNNTAFIKYKDPVFPLIVGDTTAVEDIYIHQLNVNKYSYINNKLPVEIFVNYTGKKSITKALNVYHKGSKVFSKQLQFSATKTVCSESFYLTSNTSGTQYYTARIEALENEKNTINNTKIFKVNVIEEQSKILILTSILHPDLGMLKKSIESNKQRSVTIIDAKKYKDNISDYQLVILYQPNKNFQKILNEVKLKKVNYFIITGLSTDWNFLNKSQSNFTKKTTSQTENYGAVFNPNYPIYFSKDINFSSFSPVEDVFGKIEFKVPYNTLLFQQIGAIETKEPLLVTYEKDLQKSAVLFGENVWRWRANSFLFSKNFQEFDGYISNLIQYLASNEINKRLNVTFEPIYYANESILISANYLDKNLNFDTRSKLWLTIFTSENKNLKKIPFSLINNQFSVEINSIPPGEYQFKVTVEDQKDTFTGTFVVLPFDVEQQFTNANDKDLKILALKTEGELFYTSQLDKLVQKLIADNRFKSVQKSSIIKTPLIEWQWILGFIILLLSIEWFVRKYFGKI